MAKNVVGLVYVAAFAPDEGETLGAVEAGSKDSVLNSALVPRTYPTADGGSATEFYIDPAKARDAFAGDLSDEEAALIAATQRPVAEAAFGEPNGPPAWKHLPSWAVVATGDKAAGTDVVRSMAERAGAKITEFEGSHVIMLSQPQAVTDVILEALAAVSAASEQLAGSASERDRRCPRRPRPELDDVVRRRQADRRPASSTSATSRRARPTAPRSCSCTAGRTTSTATSTSSRC